MDDNPKKKRIGGDDIKDPDEVVAAEAGEDAPSDVVEEEEDEAKLFEPLEEEEN